MEPLIHRYMDNSKQAAGVFNKYAKEYQNRFMDTTLYHDTFNLFCELIKNKNAEILEIACGPGNITNYLLSKRSDFKILGIDLAPNMIELAKINNPQAVFEVMDCREIYKIERKFDAIMCGFCLPYLSMQEVAKLFSDAAQLLLPKGVIYISTMEDDYSKSGFRRGSSGDEIFMHYFTAKELTQELSKNNFTVIDLQRLVYQEKETEKTTDLILIAVKQ